MPVRRSVLERKLEKVRGDLAAVQEDIDVLSKAVEDPVDAAAQRILRNYAGTPDPVDTQPKVVHSSPPVSPVAEVPAQRVSEPVIPHPEGRTDGRAGRTGLKLGNFLMENGFHSVQPLRHERRIQRNKAIFMIVLVVLMLIWLLARIFHS